jgi:hypothetical protein
VDGGQHGLLAVPGVAGFEADARRGLALLQHSLDSQEGGV